MLIEANLDLRKHGFKLVFEKYKKSQNIKIIYNSRRCRLKFMFSRQRAPRYDEMTIQYGRLHAPDEEPIMVWNQENCLCWHHITDPVRFLDGLTPVQAFHQSQTLKEPPLAIKQFRDSQAGKSLSEEYRPKYSLVMHNTLWRMYGEPFFDLFDLQNGDLWDSYRGFLKEYYGLLNMKAVYGPPYECVC
jgi:hypothetical protein